MDNKEKKPPMGKEGQTPRHQEGQKSPRYGSESEKPTPRKGDEYEKSEKEDKESRGGC